MITRYDLVQHSRGMDLYHTIEEVQEGDYVKYDDHKTELAEETNRAEHLLDRMLVAERAFDAKNMSIRMLRERLERFESRTVLAEKKLAIAMDALTNIGEYWNGCNHAAVDAAKHCMEVAQETLERIK